MRKTENGKIVFVCDHCGKKLIIDDNEKPSITNLKKHGWSMFSRKDNCGYDYWGHYCSTICRSYKHDTYRDLNL